MSHLPSSPLNPQGGGQAGASDAGLNCTCFRNLALCDPSSSAPGKRNPQKIRPPLPQFPHLCNGRAHLPRPWVGQHLAKSGLKRGSAVRPGASYLPLSLSFLNCKMGKIVPQRIVRMKCVPMHKNLRMLPDAWEALGNKRGKVMAKIPSRASLLSCGLNFFRVSRPV